jgi:hypothetical protein
MPYIGNPLQSTNFVTDVFVGDASTTAFTLSRTPASVTSLIIFIDGVKQASIGGSGAYTLSGTTLTFTAAPPNNAVIEVIHLGVQSLVNVPGSATITSGMLAPDLRAVVADQFTANGTGTTFTLSTVPISSNSVIVTANGVVQYDYSVSSSTLILNFTPAVNTLIRVTGIGNIITSAIVPVDDSVSTAKLQNSSVTGPKLADGAVTGPKLGQNAVSSNNIISSITLTTPILGTPTSGNLSSCTADGTNPIGYRNVPNSGAKTTSYTLVASDVGKFIELGTGGSVVVPASVFAAGDVISIFNNTTASISCTCSAITDFYKGGTDTDISSFSVTTRGVATILFITATRAVVTGNLV